MTTEQCGQDQLPIGLFDSGVGGLTVLDAMRRLMPGEDYLFLGDTARVPYGAKKPENDCPLFPSGRRQAHRPAHQAVGHRLQHGHRRRASRPARNMARHAHHRRDRARFPRRLRSLALRRHRGHRHRIHHPQRGLCRSHPPPPPRSAGPQPRLPPVRAAGRRRLVRRPHRRRRGFTLP